MMKQSEPYQHEPEFKALRYVADIGEDRTGVTDATPRTESAFTRFALGLFVFGLMTAGAYFGKDILVPVIFGLMLALLLLYTDNWVLKVPVINALPSIIRRSLILVLVAGALVFLVALVSTAVTGLNERLPQIGTAIGNSLGKLAQQLGVEPLKLESTLASLMSDYFKAGTLVPALLSAASSFGSTLFVIILYTGFILTGRANFAQKLSLAITGTETHRKTVTVIESTLENLVSYIGAKSFVNIISGLASYIIMLFYGVEFAAIFALLIAILNFVPYIGSIIAFVFPLLWSVGQFGDIWITLQIGFFLIAADTIISNVIEPKLMGRYLNMSPFLVMLSLAFWGSLWGMAGAVLAVPLTSIIMITLAAFPSSRPLARLMTVDGRMPDDVAPKISREVA